MQTHPSVIDEQTNLALEVKNHLVEIKGIAKVVFYGKDGLEDMIRHLNDVGTKLDTCVKRIGVEVSKRQYDS